ncbi:hypothetical protein [Zophobihabitans entericus]|uniref:Lipoprotein n=1 Tax=Zophobihabitans entericus TaxID=1635327 RepID=A0A6G9IBI3_9GAMM|nr:hypothetical protein [Zophobihabitans entericus]QIQ21583.1 hypothetical protein IPMB12_07735 [Zophobihabitans entericus]
MKKIWFLGYFLLLLSGCSSHYVKNYEAQKESINEPNLGMQTKAFVGESILKQGQLTRSDVLHFDKETNIKGLVFYKIYAGDYLKVGEEGNDNYYSLQEMRSGLVVQKSGSAAVPAAIKTFQDKPGIVCIPYEWGGGPMLCQKEVDYSTRTITFLNNNDYEQEIIYLGKSGNKLSFQYRLKIGNGHSTSSESYQFEHSLSDSSIVQYKGAEIKVITANSSNIEYVIVKGLNSIQ